MRVPPPLSNEASICIGCGLCCDGTLFTHLGVHDESDLGMPLRALGVEVIVEADPPAFALPCPAVLEGTCTIYHLQRPRACAAFECDVVTDLAAGVIERAEAHRIITATGALRDEVRAGVAARSALDDMVTRHFRRGRA